VGRSGPIADFDTSLRDWPGSAEVTRMGVT